MSSTSVGSELETGLLPSDSCDTFGRPIGSSTESGSAIVDGSSSTSESPPCAGCSACGVRSRRRPRPRLPSPKRLKRLCRGGASCESDTSLAYPLAPPEGEPGEAAESSRGLVGPREARVAGDDGALDTRSSSGGSSTGGSSSRQKLKSVYAALLASRGWWDTGGNIWSTRSVMLG